jgi:hypothetical protein
MLLMALVASLIAAAITGYMIVTIGNWSAAMPCTVSILLGAIATAQYIGEAYRFYNLSKVEEIYERCIKRN